MFARTFVVAALVLAGHVKNANAQSAVTCADLGADATDPGILKSGDDLFYSKNFGSSIVTAATSAISTITAGVLPAPLCISFTNFDVANGASLSFSADTATPAVGYTFSGSTVPKQFTWTPAASDVITFVAPAGSTGTGFRFTCSEGPCTCLAGQATGAAFEQSGEVIKSNGVSGTITATASACVSLSDVDLQGGTLTYNGVTYKDGDQVGPFSVTSGSEDLVFTAGPQGSEGSFTATCADTTCAPQQLSPCLVTSSPSGALSQVNQVIESRNYNSGQYLDGDNGVISIVGPACITFSDTYGIPDATLSYQGTDLSTSVAPGPISVADGVGAFLQWDASNLNCAPLCSPGFQLFCNFGACDSPTTTSAPTTTSSSTTSTTSAPSSTTTATTTQTTVVPFPVSSCTKKSCRTLVKQKKQRLFDAAGCGDSTSCKNTVKATMPYNGNKKKACKPKTRQDVCQNIYWYT